MPRHVESTARRLLWKTISIKVRIEHPDRSGTTDELTGHQGALQQQALCVKYKVQHAEGDFKAAIANLLGPRQQDVRHLK